MWLVITLTGFIHFEVSHLFVDLSEAHVQLAAGAFLLLLQNFALLLQQRLSVCIYVR